MTTNTNIGYAFPLEKLGSDIARNDYNYQSILNGLIEWNNSNDDNVKIRLTKDSTPWFEDYIIPSKKSLFDLNSLNTVITGVVDSNSFVIDSKIDTAFYGGSRSYVTRVFDSYAGINPTLEHIILTDYTGFSINTMVKFESTASLTPVGLSKSKLYYITNNPLSDNFITLIGVDGVAVDLSQSGGIGDIKIIKYNASPEVSKTDPGDIVTLRYTVDNSGSASWINYYYPITSAWTSGQSYRFGNIVEYSSVLYKCTFDVTDSPVAPNTDLANFAQLFKAWTENTSYYAGDIVISNGIAYIATVDVNGTLIPSNDSSYQLFANAWVSNGIYSKGSYVYYNGNTYVSLVAVSGSTTLPSVDVTRWEKIVLFKVPVEVAFSQSKLTRWGLNRDVAGFILRNVGTSSTLNTNIQIRISARTKEHASIYQRSVDSFATSNFSLWPDSARSVWNAGETYGPTDTDVAINKRQSYTASMIFDHTDLNTAKTVNYVNYDGPDLDQGLCVYLPVLVNVADGGVAEPEDGFTYDFFFRIWPSTIYTNAVTRDHIVNKSQIYVYSVDHRDNIVSDMCDMPIAKFSMARLTNYYLFNQNVSIPDKPVCYRATFTYSTARQNWMMLDYYQLPDHLFMGPVGFIDPQNPANLDINGINSGNPNPIHIGYETAAFPMFQDPFSNSDLSPYKLEGDGTTTYIKRILS